MKNQKYEQISALMDDQISLRKEREAAITSLLEDDEAQRMWHEYHLIRDCLQNRRTRPDYAVDPAFRERLQKEVRLRLRKRDYFAANRTFRGFAAAAAVAAVSVAVWQMAPVDNPAAASLSRAPEGSDVGQTLASVEENRSREKSGMPVLALQNPHPAGMTVTLDNPYLQAHQRAMNTDGLMRVSASFDGAKQ